MRVVLIGKKIIWIILQVEGDKFEGKDGFFVPKTLKYFNGLGKQH